jgi:hypothetical protein
MNAIDLMRSFDIDVVGIIHVGANIGQERDLYLASGAQNCVYIEPLPAIFDVLHENLKGYPGHRAVQQA